MAIYNEDVTYIHDAGFGWFALRSATGLLSLLRQGGVDKGVVVDLGCGSGIWTRQLGFAGYSTLGIDASEPMIRRARETVPGGDFRCADAIASEIPKCDAVTAVGEVLSFALEVDEDGKRMRALFRRIYRALRKGGLFIFDFATNGRKPGGMKRKDFWQGEDWAALLEAHAQGAVLTRNLTTFRQVDGTWRRGTEVHRLRLYDPASVARELEHAGFEPRRLRGFGEVRFGSGHAGFLARKPT
jgi:SAM-dependent methyltransferase